MNKFYKEQESGRSMVEMLGVLAIIGVLSVGGIAGYTTAMNKYRANEIADAASKVAVMAEVASDGTADLGAIGLDGPVGGCIDEIGSDGLNIIFISHFHSDHINGIKYLLDKANKSHPMIVMPLIGEDLGIVYFIENLSEYYVTTNGDNISFDDETISFYQKLLFSNDDRFIRINHEDGAKHIGLNIKSKNCPREEDWLYIPVACIDNDLTGYAQAVLSELQKKYPGIADTLKLGEAEAIAELDWKYIYNTIREVKTKDEFKRVNLNNMSLMLYSGIGRPMNVFENKCCDYFGRCYDYHCFRRCHHYHDRTIFSGALYTGDMEKEDAGVSPDKKQI